ncbi:iron chelate uptake ABC transporter family permease subunit [Gordonia sp. HNM0687]|uniref:Iron chelate uptake ABC transporter family permease subunit n=1 Tax=Gordonia mangrovi TaxID=2665643 RepID=A0A6L7GM66_9ACTN|nr:iron chelate uptake ABC transporter family permease subunit [Gordonia mangrovi]MXP19865.1 iron chelate uptake ABC transporter family permease subunit [Gordonia mangrovi]UVF79512.1 iron chelate uptake ABC transporter family permease subunit [Gordonia mangrovi]
MTGIVLLTAVLVVALLASVAIGTRQLGLGEVIDALQAGGWPHLALTHFHGVPWVVLESPTAPPGADDVYGIVWDLRFPRTVLGLVVGLAIGAAGALAQGHTRNPLADPGMLGVNAGAACAVVVGVYVLGIQSPIAYMAFGLLGALIAASAVFGLSALSGASPLTLVLAGTGLSALLLAITSGIVLTDSVTLDAWRFWNVGATTGRGLDVFSASLPFIVVGLILALGSGYFLNVLSLGEDMTKALGSRVVLIRSVGILTITLLIGAATAACGPIVFLGLVVPHISRAIVGPDYRWIVPYSALLGAILILVCDILGRVIARPGEIQVGVVLALVGAPFLIALVRRRKLVSV